MSAARSFARLLKGSHRWLAGSVVLALLQSGLLVAMGLLIRFAFDSAIPDDRLGALVATGTALLALSLASTGLALWTRYLVLGATKRAVARLRVALLECIQGLPASWFDRVETGPLHSTIVQDSERVDVMSNALAAQLLPAALMTSALSVALGVLNPLLFGLLVATFPILIVLSRSLGAVVRRRTRAWQDAFDRFSTRMQFALRARSLVAAQTAEETELAAARAEIVRLSATGQAMAWVQSAYGHFHGAIGAVAGALVLVVGGAAVARGSMTLGSLVAFYALVALWRGQASTLLGTVPQVISGGESLRRLEAILDADEPPPYTGRSRPSFVQTIALHDVHFGYRDGAPVLRGAQLAISPGERVALVGANGAGKSTVSALILGFYRPWRGFLTADGVPFDELDIRALRRRIALVPQDPVLFSGTIAENIRYGNPEADLDCIRAAAERATAARFIEALPAGYETPVGDEGGLLSGGEGQRVAIARALLREPALLILDEPTSSLDRGAVSALLTRLRGLPQEPAILLISHDPEVVAEADSVFRLVDGVTHAVGRPAETALAVRR